MRRIYCFCAVALLVWTVSGCGFNKRIWLCKKVLSMNNELCDLMSQIKDEASAKETKPKLDVLKKRYDEEIKPEDEKLKNEKLKKEEFEEIIALLKDDIQYVGTRFGVEHARLEGRPEWSIVSSAVPTKLFDLPLPQNQPGMGLGGR
jgi:hypothetical protein